MPNVILTPDMITNKSLEILENELVISRNVNRQYDDSFAQRGAKIGDTLRIRKPARFLVTDGPALQVQEFEEEQVPLKVSTQKQVGLNFTSAELTMKLDDFADRVLKPAVSQLAATIDNVVASSYRAIGQSVGTPGNTPSTSAVLLQAMQKMNEAAAPMGSRYATVNPAANAALVEGMKGLFNPVGTISKQFKNGLMGEGILGYEEFAMSQSIDTHKCGSRAAVGATTNAAVVAEGATSITLTGLGANATVLEGDVFSIEDCYAVNPQTRKSTGSLYQFVCLESVQASAGGIATITVYPMYSAAHAKATVNVLPQNGKAAIFMGAANGEYAQNLIYHKDAIALATADLVIPNGVDMASRKNYKGISMRFISQYDINNDRLPKRLDVLFGYQVIRPELAVRLWG